MALGARCVPSFPLRLFGSWRRSMNVWAGRSKEIHRLSSPARLLEAIRSDGIIVVPCAHDGLSAKLIARAGRFDVLFLSGFGVAASKGMPDTGLTTFSEVLAAVSDAAAVCGSVCVIADGDTGFGNELNCKRTVHAFARAGASAVMIEDQVFPKRCAYAEGGAAVVRRDEALRRCKAACDARDEGADIAILARTDARGDFGVDEAIERCTQFHDLGADIVHAAGLKTEEELRRFCAAVPGPKMHNNNSAALVLPPQRLQELGFALVIYPDLLLGSVIRSMDEALGALTAATQHKDAELHRSVAFAPSQSFSATKELCGFPEYDRDAATYAEPLIPP